MTIFKGHSQYSQNVNLPWNNFRPPKESQKKCKKMVEMKKKYQSTKKNNFRTIKVTLGKLSDALLSS